MKGLACSRCGDLRALSHDDLKPVSCACGNVTGWWLDGRRGVARYTAEAPAYALGVGFNNSFLKRAFESRMMETGTYLDEQWREWHDEACQAPGYLFDASRRGCWVIFFRPGDVRDVEWATNEERAVVAMAPYPPGHALDRNA